ncbi:hypothetical protein PFISCL1PPCAC_23483, partial [Pristionchus fissidentatus]
AFPMFSSLLPLLLIFSLVDSRHLLPLGRHLRHCHWEGFGPICLGECPFEAFEVMRAGEETGDGGSFGKPCFLGQKALCCSRNRRIF